MFPIFLPKQKAVAIAELCDSKKLKKSPYDDTILFKILNKPSHILVYGEGAGILVDDCQKVSDGQDFSDAGIIYNVFLSSGCSSIDACDDILEDIEKDNSNILNYTGSFFVLDNSVNLNAAQLSDEYGVLCQSEEDMDISVLYDEFSRYEFDPLESVNIQWEDILKYVSGLPTNSLFICDRYLFQGDNFYVYVDGERKYRYDGINNIVKIIKSIVSPKLKCDFHLTIITSPDNLGYKHNMTVEQLYNELSKQLSDNRIKISILTIRSDAEFNDRLSHDRRIISPYFLVEAFKGVNIIRYDKDNKGTDEAHYSQVIQTLHLFSSGIQHSDSATPYETIERFKNDFRKLVEHYEKSIEEHDKYSFLTSNGETDLLCHRNRMLDSSTNE